MKKQLRVGVIGVGYLGRFHALIYSRLPNVKLVGVADLDAVRAAEVAVEVGCVAFGDPLALLGLVDAVSVVVPTSVHLDVARPYLQQGVHMLLEKPMAQDMHRASEILQLAEASGAMLQIGHLERFNAGIMELAKRIDTPRFIEAQRMGGFSERATDVDVVSDLMIHDIDIILSLVASDLSDVRAVGARVLSEHVDIAKPGWSLSTAPSRTSSQAGSRTERLGAFAYFEPRCYLSLDFVTQTLDIAAPVASEDVQRPEIRRERVAVEPVKPLDREIEAFVHCVRRRERPLVDGAVGLKALEVALRVRKCIGA